MQKIEQAQLYSSGNLPKRTHVALPALSPTMEFGTVVSWQKKEGDQLSKGDLLCEIETDKATKGFETPEEGYLAKVLIQEGSKDVPIGKLLCIIVENEADLAAFKDFKDEGGADAPKASAPAPDAPKSPAPASSPAPSTPQYQPQSIPQSGPPPTSGRVSASPSVKKLAHEQGLDLAGVTGSGPGGRVLASDLAQARQLPYNPEFNVTIVQCPLEKPPKGPCAPLASEEFVISGGSDYIDIPLTNMRKTIAKRLTESKSTIPHDYLTSEIQLDTLMQVREKLNGLLAKGTSGNATKISINDFIIKASALACAFIRENHHVDVSVAESTPAGLLTLIIFNAHAKGLATIASEVVEQKAREGKLQPREYQGGKFEMSKFGLTCNVTVVQTLILAIGGASDKLDPDENDGYKKVKSLKVTLSCDHRTVDGAVGAVWLRHFKEFLEDPLTMLL